MKDLKQKADDQEAKADAAIEELGSFGSIMKQLVLGIGEALVKVIPMAASAAMGPAGVAAGAMSNVKNMANGSANSGTSIEKATALKNCLRFHFTSVSDVNYPF